MFLGAVYRSVLPAQALAQAPKCWDTDSLRARVYCLHVGLKRPYLFYPPVPPYAEQTWSFSLGAMMRRGWEGSSAFRYSKGTSPTLGGRVGPSAAEGRGESSEKLLLKMPGALWNTLCAPPHSRPDADCVGSEWQSRSRLHLLSLVPNSQNAP